MISRPCDWEAAIDWEHVTARPSHLQRGTASTADPVLSRAGAHCPVRFPVPPVQSVDVCLGALSDSLSHPCRRLPRHLCLVASFLHHFPSRRSFTPAALPVHRLCATRTLVSCHPGSARAPPVPRTSGFTQAMTRRRGYCSVTIMHDAYLSGVFRRGILGWCFPARYGSV